MFFSSLDLPTFEHCKIYYAGSRVSDLCSLGYLFKNNFSE